MAHHKRKRPKNRRAGCLLCKPWKMNGISKDSSMAERFSDHKRRAEASSELAAASRRGMTCRPLASRRAPHLKMDRINELWREHEQAPFPPELRGEEIQGEDLVLLDSYAAGCVSTFRGVRALDKQSHECLVGSRDALANVVPLLAGDARG